LKKLKSEYKNFAFLIQKEIPQKGNIRLEKDGVYLTPYKTKLKRKLQGKIQLAY